MSFLRNARAGPVAVGRAATAELVAEDTADEMLEELILGATFSTIWCATETGTVYETNR
jgi:hypothetical protein